MVAIKMRWWQSRCNGGNQDAMSGVGIYNAVYETVYEAKLPAVLLVTFQQ